MVTVDTYSETCIVKDQITRAIAQECESFDRLIHPDDIQDGAESWDDIPNEKLEMDAHDSASIMLSEGQRPYHGYVCDLAICLRRDDMMRVPKDDLVYDNIPEMVGNGYWPYDMNRAEITEELYELGVDDLHPDYVQEAHEYVSNEIVENLIDV